MGKVIILGRSFPAYHPKSGEPTWFVEKVWGSLLSCGKMSIFDTIGYEAEYQKYFPCGDNPNESVAAHSPKHHTIQPSKQWKTGDMASIRVWSGKPYRSQQIAIAPDVRITVKEFEIDKLGHIFIDGKKCEYDVETLAVNDGLDIDDMFSLFNVLPFSGQMLIWSDVKLPY